MKNSIRHAVREACLWLPEAQEAPSHGSSSFKVRGRIYAYFLVNHHGDGRVALWLNLPPGLQESYVGTDPRRFFVPPYLGPRGWVGVDLEKGLSWMRVAALVRAAYERVAPAALARSVGKTPQIQAPPRRMSASERDPLRSARGKTLLKTLRGICLKWPETAEATQFGHPVWRAGRRSFASARALEGRLSACFWVGVDRQPLLIADRRYRVPPYVGHGGWIAVDVSGGVDRREIAALALESYRHFALKRMLRAMG